MVGSRDDRVTGSFTGEELHHSKEMTPQLNSGKLLLTFSIN